MARALFAERLGEKVHSSWTCKNYSAILDSVGQTEEAQIAAEKTRNILVCRNQYPSAISKPALRSSNLQLFRFVGVHFASGPLLGPLPYFRRALTIYN